MICVGQNPKTSVLRKAWWETQKEEERPCEDGSEIGVIHPQAKEFLKLLETGQGKEGFTPKMFRRSADLLPS